MGTGKILIILMLLCSSAFAESIPNFPDWNLSAFPGDEEMDYPRAFVLSHKDGRAPITLNPSVADQIKAGANPEQIYLGRTRTAFVKDGQVLGNTGLVAPTEIIYSTAIKEDRPASNNGKNGGASGGPADHGASGNLGSAGGIAGSTSRNPSSIINSNGNGSAGNYGGAAGSGGSSNYTYTPSAPVTPAQGSGVAGTNGTQGVQAGNAGVAASGNNAATAQAYYQQYYGAGSNGANGAYIPFDTNSGQYDPNIKAGANTGLNEIYRRAGKYAPR